MKLIRYSFYKLGTKDIIANYCTLKLIYFPPKMLLR